MLAAALAGAGTLFLLQNITKQDTKKPHFDVLATRDHEGLSQETNDILRIITIDPETFPVGSFKYRAHRYPGDIDIFEQVKVCCTKQNATKEIANKIINLAIKISNASNRGVFFGDFKAGIDDRYKIDIGKIEASLRSPDAKVIGYNGSMVRRNLQNLLDSKLITPEEHSNLISLTPLKDITPDQWEKLYEALRKFFVIRWKIDELIAGQKTIGPDNKLIKLEDAITHDSVVKIDIWAPIKGKYNELTNFFLFYVKYPDGSEEVLNAKLPDRLKSLEKDIVKYSSKEHRNSLKLAKRLWNVALTRNDEKFYDQLYPLFDSDATLLSQINSEIEVISGMLTKLPKNNIPIKTIIKQIDSFKERITNTLEIQFNTAPSLELIDKILQHYRKNPSNWDPEYIVNNLEQLSDKLKDPIEQYSSNFLKQVLSN